MQNYVYLQIFQFYWLTISLITDDIHFFEYKRVHAVLHFGVLRRHTILLAVGQDDDGNHSCSRNLRSLDIMEKKKKKTWTIVYLLKLRKFFE